MRSIANGNVLVVLVLLSHTTNGPASAQAVGARANSSTFAAATIREYQQELTTYPFSDPNPIPVLGKVYPYFRFDGFTDQPETRAWKVIDLENEWIRVSILPEIGGKIWRAIDKATGKSFIYDNHVVKFRDIAMRGPWTSGGIEANYGIIGHTPNVATPVDYVTQQDADGGVTCTIGALDLLTRTSWRLAITLPADKAYFTTSSFWHNGTPLEQPYYSWMNAAIPVSDDLEYIYSGNRFIGHNGEVGDWPVNTSNGKTISWYRNNDFGGYKSYHVFGNYTDFFGAFWHNQNFGMARYAPHDEKPGKKLWIWGLSRQGMIWEQLLTDRDGQYTEVQSGRLFNQTAEASSATPFKHRGFTPYSSERWTEYWFPVKGTNGFVTANAWGALNVQASARGVALSLSPVQSIADSLEVFDGTRRIYARMLRLAPLDAWRDTAPAVSDPSQLRVTLGGYKIDWVADTAATALRRPLTADATFDWKSSYGLYLSGKEKVRERDFVGATRDLSASVALDSNFIPALVDLAAMALRRGDWAFALERSRRALRIDTYDGAANFTYAVANLRGGRRVDARDGFDIAAQSAEYRSAAWTALARMYLADGNLPRALDYATKALDYNRFDLDALQVRAVAHRVRGDRTAAALAITALRTLDPLSHFAQIETGLAAGTDSALRAAALMIRNEMPAETLLELALWYADVGQITVADQVLALSPPHAEVLYWRAFLHERLGHADVLNLLSRAEAQSPHLVFPFRTESAEVMRWAMTKTESWLPAYYLGLQRWSVSDSAAARALFRGLAERPTYAPFYAARAELFKSAIPASAFADLQRASVLDPSEWRYGRLLTERALADSAFANAVRMASALYIRFPRNASLGMLFARTLLRDGQNVAARRLLDTLVVLPYEGSGEAHALYREANLLGAVERVRARDTKGALALVAKARLWPERLGAGRPYDTDVDERVEQLVASFARGDRASQAKLDADATQLLGATRDPVSERVIRALMAPPPARRGLDR